MKRRNSHAPANNRRFILSAFYRKLFQSTFLISAFTVGGGFVIIPLLRAKYVEEYGWLTDKDTLNLVSIAQSMPGVVAVNASIILGYRMAGLRGTLTALAATILPPLITLSIISCAYDWFASNPYVRYALKGMQCGATALIVNVAIDLLQNNCGRNSYFRWPSLPPHSPPISSSVSISCCSSSSTGF